VIASERSLVLSLDLLLCKNYRSEPLAMIMDLAGLLLKTEFTQKVSGEIIVVSITGLHKAFTADQL
jgi:hypothetical protein